MALQHMFHITILVGFYIAIFLYTVIIHEVMHGYVALKLGDPTAKYSGRLTLNPISHIDLWGSVIIPIIMFLTFQFPFGWAKPVPYNPYNLRNQKWGSALVALGGPGSNIVIAVLAALAAKFIAIPVALKIEIIRNFNNWSDVSGIIAGSFGSIFYEVLIMVVFWNVLLAFFNLIPFPPLDGSKLLFAVLPIKTETMMILENFGFMILLLVILVFAGPLGTFLNFMLNTFFSFAI